MEREAHIHEREKHPFIASCTHSNWGSTSNLGLCTVWESNCWPWALLDDAQPTKPPSQGTKCLLLSLRFFYLGIFYIFPFILNDNFVGWSFLDCIFFLYLFAYIMLFPSWLQSYSEIQLIVLWVFPCMCPPAFSLATFKTLFSFFLIKLCFNGPQNSVTKFWSSCFHWKVLIFKMNSLKIANGPENIHSIPTPIPSPTPIPLSISWRL